MIAAGRLYLPLLTLVALGAPPVRAQELHLIPGIEEIATDTLEDIAVATVDLPHPVIYYNPRLAHRYGPLLTRFFLAHEYGHIYHKHSRVAVFNLPVPVRDSVLRSEELEADCFAASQSGEQDREASEAALRFFSRLGPFRFDAEHPTGAQRAARILQCMPAPRGTEVYGRGETGVEVGPVSGEPDLIKFEVVPAELGAAEYGSQAQVYIDGQRLGAVSNMRLMEPLTVNRFGAGIHNYRVVVQVYGLDPALQFNDDGVVTGRGQILLRNGDRFRVDWVPGSAPTLVREGTADGQEP
ncbi:MAG TPA: hypothetical protein VMG41_07515 [Gemmatimonadales bacterium]|nr:hypothetical protein [Gemmatimonadales bacterium]